MLLSLCLGNSLLTSSVALLRRRLILSVCGAEEGEGGNENKQQVEDGGPSREGLGRTLMRDARHDVCNVLSPEDTS